jgi:hypothetical protein
MLGSIGMQCRVGDCLYPGSHPQPSPAPAPSPGPRPKPHVDHPEILTIAFVGVLLLLFSGGVGYLVVQDRTRMWQMEHFGDEGDFDHEMLSLPQCAPLCPLPLLEYD